MRKIFDFVGETWFLAMVFIASIIVEIVYRCNGHWNNIRLDPVGTIGFIGIVGLALYVGKRR